MDKKLIEISKEYLLTTEKVKKIISKAFNLNNKEEIMRFRNIMAKGTFYLNYIKHSFCYHGIGMHFSSEFTKMTPESSLVSKPIEIDFDFGFDDHFSGMDPWKIYNYMCHHYPDLKEKYTIDMVRVQFDDALKQNKIFKKHSLYYFHVKHKEKLNGIDEYLNVKPNIVPAFDSKDIKSNLNLFLKRPGLYIGTNRYDYSRIFIGNIPGGKNWDSDYDIQSWLFINESILIPHAKSITGWSLLPIYFGNRQKAMDALKSIVNEIPFTLKNESSFINLPSLLVYDLYSLYHFKFLDRREVIENTQSKLHLHKQIIEETFSQASYTYEKIINIVKKMIKEEFSRLHVYLHYQNFFLQVRFIYLNKKEEYIDLINLKDNDDYFANLIMLHVFAELAQKEEDKNCIISLKYTEGKVEVSRYETKDIWFDIFNEKVDISTADKNTLYDQYEDWKVKIINEK